MKIKLTSLLLFLCFCTFCYHEAFASGSGSGSAGTVQETPPQFGEIDYDSSKTTYEMLCDLRKMFCGPTAIVMVSFVIVTIGFLIFKGKLSWTFVIVLLSGVFIFVGASEVTRIIANPPPGLGVVSACEC